MRARDASNTKSTSYYSQRDFHDGSSTATPSTIDDGDSAGGVDVAAVTVIVSIAHPVSRVSLK